MNYKRIFKKKNIDELLQHAQHNPMKRTLDAMKLVMLGIGAIVGAGIFVLAGTAAGASAGPAVVLSFIVGGIACACAALCYAEMAATIPISGGAYTYTYVALGEMPAWLIGSFILVGNSFMVAAVAVGWSGYVVSFLEQMSINLPTAFTHHVGEVIVMNDGTTSVGVFNLLACAIVLMIGTVLYKGTETSALLNNIIVIIKIGVLTSFVLIGVMYINPENWTPFIPEHIDATGQFGIQGIFGGAAIVFLAFNGFDTVASAAQETKNPQRDLPIGIIGSLLVSMIVYVLVSGVLTGLVHYTKLNSPQSMALAVNAMNMPWLAIIIKVGAICGLSSVALVMTYAIIRVTFSMSNDGLLPKSLQKIHAKNKTPHVATVVITVIIALLAGAFPLDTMAQMGNFCVITTFIVVSVLPIYLRHKQPDLKREFMCPMLPFIPVFGIVLLLSFLVSMPNKNIMWYFLGLVILSSIYYLITHGCKKEKNEVLAEQ